MLVIKILTVIFYCVFSLVQSERCFHCTNKPDPSNCTTIETCGPDQACSIRQFVTSDGNVLYNSQCLDKTQCGTLSNVIGRRNLVGRAYDVTTCYECCDQDFCNNQGCNTKAVPRDQRGPYCYTCDASTDPKACTDVSICKETEQCIVIVSPELTTSSQLVYRSMCESKAACAALSHVHENSSCPPDCCDQDFCNDHCQSVGSTATTAVVCDTSAGYQLVQDITASLCVKVYTNHKDWDSARAVCVADGGDLAVLDSSDKGVLLRNTIMKDHTYSHQAGYWIGARDFDLSNTFVWVNNIAVDVLNGDWDTNQPNHFDAGHDQDCAVMWRGSTTNYQWHDDYCLKQLGFICQRA